MASSLEDLRAALAGRYEIERELGQGGMATVYLADDLKHDRQVAIKVLRPELAAVLGAERFLNEIKVTANLQHPHILPLFDSGRTGGQADGRADDFLYYVMPYVEGESLREKLNREKQLPIEDAVRLATEVAEALEYAHKQSVIHRDIKPENILLHNDSAMVADFGIALAVQQAGRDRLTETGLSLGTPQYMSPEQTTAERELDARSDVYSLGAMLYEMLVGEPPFTGPTAQAIVASILTKTPEAVEDRRITTPENVADAVHTALEKLPADRFGSAKAFADALGNPAVARHHPRSRRFQRSAKVTSVSPTLVIAGLIAALTVGAGAGWLLRPVPATVDRLEIHFPRDQQLVNLGGGYPTVHQLTDGAELVYGGVDASGTNRLFRRRFGSARAEPIPGPVGTAAAAYVWPSPDGTQLALLTVPDLRTLVMPVGGGEPFQVTDSLYSMLAWGPDGMIYGIHTVLNVVARIAPQGGLVETLAAPDSTRQTAHWMPHPLPNGRGVLVTVRRGSDRQTDAHVGVLDLVTGRVTQLTQGFGARYANSGHVVFARRDSSLYAARFDADRLEMIGNPVQVVRGIGIRADGFFVSNFSLSLDGTLVYTPADQLTYRESLAWVDRAGRELAVGRNLPQVRNPRFSPSGTRVAFQGVWDIFVSEGASRPLSQLTTLGWNLHPSWRDEETVTITVLAQGGSRSLANVPSDGSRSLEPILSNLPHNVLSGTWHADGGSVVVIEEPTRSVISFTESEDDAPQSFTDGTADEHSPSLSPDGGWLAYVSGGDVWVAAFPGKRDRVQVSVDGGTEPRWANDGNGLYFRAGDSLYVAPVQLMPQLEVGLPAALFSVESYAPGLRATNYDVSADGEQLVFVKQLGNRPQYVVVERNWVSKLRNLVAGR